MLDNLRESASQSPFFQEEPPPPEKQPPSRLRRRRSFGPFLGMTPMQRFVIALMLFLITCMLGTLCLLVTEKIVIHLF